MANCEKNPTRNRFQFELWKRKFEKKLPSFGESAIEDDKCWANMNIPRKYNFAILSFYEDEWCNIQPSFLTFL